MHIAGADAFVHHLLNIVADPTRRVEGQETREINAVPG
jgi:hypothetical protein